MKPVSSATAIHDSASKTASPLHLQALEISGRYRQCEAELIEILARIESAKVFLEMGYLSLFAYAVDALRLSEAQASNFINVMRKSREVPELKAAIVAGELTVSKARKIVPVLTRENQETWIRRALVLPKARLEQEVAKVAPEVAKVEVVRRTTETRSRLHLDVSDEILSKLKRAQTLSSNRAKRNKGLEETLHELLDFYLARKDPLRSVRSRSNRNGNRSNGEPSMTSLNVNRQESSTNMEALDRRNVRVMKRHIPARTKREVLVQARGRCEFRSQEGRVCGAERGLELHHLRPWSLGGDHRKANLMVLCWQHHHLRHGSLRSSFAASRSSSSV